MRRRLNLLPALTLLSLIVAATALPGCSTTAEPPPPVAARPGSTHLPGKLVGHDLLTTDPDAARTFYRDLFGWTFAPPSTDDGIEITISNRGRPIGGLFDGRTIADRTNVSRWVPVLSVTDVDRAIQLVESEDGSIYQAPIDIKGRGRTAVVGDSRGAVLTLVSSSDGDLKDQAPRIGNWLWDELWTDKPQQASAFYLALVANFGIRVRYDGGETLRILTSQGKARGSIRTKPDPQVPHTWLGYVLVTDPEALATKVTDLGGRVLMAPRENPSGGSVAMFADPSGAGFLVQSLPVED